MDQLSKIISEAELSKQAAISHWQQEAENIRQNYRVSQLVPPTWWDIHNLGKANLGQMKDSFGGGLIY